MSKTNQVVFLNAGQGDSTLVRLKTGEVFLIDSNRDGRGQPAALEHLKRWHEETGRADVELLCLTHPDADHYRGMAEIVEWVWAQGGEIRNVLLPPFPGPRELGAVMKAAGERLARVNKAEALRVNRELREYDRLRVVVNEVAGRAKAAGGVSHRGYGLVKRYGKARVKSIGPTTAVVEKYTEGLVEEMARALLAKEELEGESANGISCVLWLTVGRHNVLLPGDATSEALAGAVEFYEQSDGKGEGGEPLPRFDVVKAAHHGAKSSSSAELWARLLGDEAAVVVSAGGNAKFGHPHDETLEQIRQAERRAKLYCTNECAEHAGGRRRKRPPVLGTALRDGRRAAGVVEKAERRAAYHGHCEFEVGGKGKVKAVTQCTPGRMCARHEGLR